ncbi:MAG: peptidylprolyl isomerase [Gemmataceae bacterium]
MKKYYSVWNPVGKLSLAACLGLSTGGLLTGQDTPAGNPAALGQPLGQQQPAGAPGTRVVAMVNGENITQAELDLSLKQLGPSPILLGTNRVRQQQLEALSMMIDDILMKQFLKKNAPEIKETEIDKKMADLVSELKKANKTLEDMHKENGFTVDQIRTNLRTKLQWLAYASSKYNEADLKKYWDTNRDFFDGVMVHVSHIALRTPPGMTPTEREDLFKRMANLRQMIQSGQLDFATAAKKYSQEASGQQGGDLGFIPRKWAVDETFAKAAFTMKAGELSQPVVTEFAIQLIKVNDRRAGKPNDYKRIHDDVREFHNEEMFQTLLGGLRKSAKIEIFVQ